jgi:adenylate kinase family enzyme
MRCVVIGTSGSGKSTFARRLAQARAMGWVELDLINWRPGWQDRNTHEPEAFVADVEAAIAADAWAVSGGYSKVRRLIWARATHLVWLDLPRWLVMRQVLTRSLGRAMGGGDVFPGCREDWARLVAPDHPIRFAWRTHARRRETFTALLAEPDFAHLAVTRVTSRREAEAALTRLSDLPP